MDRAALDVAIARGLPHGGTCPRGRRAEDGAIPERYRLAVSPSSEYAVRTEQNVVDADATLVVCRGRPRGGTALTIRLAREHARPCLVLDLERSPDPVEAARWLRSHQVGILNVAGPRESGSPGIGAAAGRLLEGILAAHQGGRGTAPLPPDP